jgi:hypothetical protein
MPSNSEKLQRINDIPYDGDIPETEDDDCHCDYLGISQIIQPDVVWIYPPRRAQLPEEHDKINKKHTGKKI